MSRLSVIQKPKRGQNQRIREECSGRQEGASGSLHGKRQSWTRNKGSGGRNQEFGLCKEQAGRGQEQDTGVNSQPKHRMC